MSRLPLLALAFSLVWCAPAFAQGTIFLVRHAERADSESMAGGSPGQADPSLSKAGHARAASLASLLKDAGITTIYVTEFKRTQETAAPLAKAMGIKPTTIVSKDMPGLVAKLRASSANVLVVGHSNTVPDVIKALGVTTPVSIGNEDFDNLFIVTAEAPPRFIRLHYR